MLCWQHSNQGPSKPETFTQYRFNVGPPSATLAKHWVNITCLLGSRFWAGGLPDASVQPQQWTEKSNGSVETYVLSEQLEDSRERWKSHKENKNEVCWWKPNGACYLTIRPVHLSPNGYISSQQTQRYWPNAGVVLDQRRKEWTSSTPALGQGLMCAGSYYIILRVSLAYSLCQEHISA